MAGTRLTITTVIVSELILLLGIALYLANDSNHLSFSKYGLSLCVNRRGITILESAISSLVSVRASVDKVRHPIHFHISSVVSGNSCRADGYCDANVGGMPGQDDIVNSLRLGLDSIINEKQQHQQADHSYAQFDISVSKPSQTRTSSGTCDDVALRFGMSDDRDPTRTTETGETVGNAGYDIFVSTGCTDASLPSGHNAKLNVDDMGDMLLLIREGLSGVDIADIIRDDVARFIADEFLISSYYGNDDAVKSSWVESTSTMELIVTLINEEPFSYISSQNITTDTAFKHRQNHNHQTRLLQSLSSSVSTYLNPMLQSRLSPLLDNFHLQTQILPYRKRKRSSLSYHSAMKNGEYTLDVIHARDIILNDDNDHREKNGNSATEPSLAKSRRNYWNTISHVETADDSLSTFNFILYVPPMGRLPLRVTSSLGEGDEEVISYGTAFSIPERFTAVSIINLDSGADSGYNSNNENDYYDKAVAEALSYFGSFLRQSIGLSIRQPHQKSASTNISTILTEKGSMILNHVATPYGMAHWEIDNLMRMNWKGKAIEIVDRLENLLSLIKWKRDIAFSTESAQKVNSCLQHLKEALLSIDKDVWSIRQSTRSLNTAHRIATALSIDSEMVALSHVSGDQLFAVIGSMIVPLILPFTLGFLREYKRYRRLILKRKGGG